MYMSLLESSCLLKTLENNENVIPEKFKITNIKDNKLVINNDKEFFLTINKLRFYMVEKLPYEIYDYMLLHKNKQSLKQTLQTEFKDFFWHEFEILIDDESSKTIINKKYSTNYIHTTFLCIGKDKLHNYFNLLNYLILKDYKYDFYTGCYDYLLNKQNIQVDDECFQFINDLYKKGIYNKDCQSEILRCCGKFGNLELIIYIHKNWCSNNICTKPCNHTSWNSNICASTAKRGHLETLKYLHQNGCEWTNQTTCYAMTGSSLECLKYAIENGCNVNLHISNHILHHIGIWEYMYGEPDYTRKYKPDKLGCIKYILDNCNYDLEDPMVCANAGDNLELLKFLHEFGFSWDDVTTRYAGSCGNLETLKYAIINGCPIDEYTGYYAATNNNIECIKCLYEIGHKFKVSLYEVCKKGHFKILTYLYEIGCRSLTSDCYDIAMCDRYYKILEFLDKHNCPKPNKCMRCYTEFESKEDLKDHLTSKIVCKDKLIKISREDVIKKFNL